jgi:hypothetical protein
MDGTLVLKMDGMWIDKGFGYVKCLDMETLDWVKDVIIKMRGGSFQLYDGKDISGPTVKVGLWVKERARPSPKFFFPAISKQNGGLDTSRWRILSANPQNRGQFLILGIDEESYKAIQPPAKLSYYTDQLKFKFNLREESLTKS